MAFPNSLSLDKIKVKMHFSIRFRFIYRIAIFLVYLQILHVMSKTLGAQGLQVPMTFVTNYP